MKNFKFITTITTINRQKTQRKKKKDFPNVKKFVTDYMDLYM